MSKSTYCLLAPLSNKVKIGSTSHPESRFKTIQSMSPEMLLMEVFPFGDGANLERMIHRQLEDSRSHGEWFHIDKKTCAVIGKNGLSETLLSIDQSKTNFDTDYLMESLASSYLKKFNSEEITLLLHYLHLGKK